MGVMDGITNRDSREARGKAISARMKAYWARRRAAVETGVREEPRSEPATNPHWQRQDVTAEERERSFDAMRAMLKRCTPAGEACSRCGHGLGVHDYRGCSVGACRCGAFR